MQEHRVRRRRLQQPLPERQVEAELRRERTLLDSVVKQMGDGLTVTDERGVFVIFNPAAERLLGAGTLATARERWTEDYQLYRPDGVTPFPVSAPRQAPGGDSPRLEYDLHTFSSGPIQVWVYLSPRNNVLHSDGLKYAVSIDDGLPQEVNVTTALNGIPMNRSWERNTSDNVNLTSTRHTLASAGEHTLKFWMVDPTVILQKIAVDTGGLRPSYLGPPESARGTR